MVPFTMREMDTKRVRLLGSLCTQAGLRTRHHCEKGEMPQSVCHLCLSAEQEQKTEIKIKIKIKIVDIIYCNYALKNS